MKDLFQDILQLDEVYGVVFLRRNGTVAFSDFTKIAPSKDIRKIDWLLFLNVLGDTGEIELIFEKMRFYIRQSDSDVLIVIAGRFAPIAMIRLNCDIVLPALAELSQKPKGLKRFFTRS